MNPEPITLVKEIVPHRDFFQAQFLLLIVPGGLTNVTVDTSLVDFEGRLWMTGPRAILSVRVIEESGGLSSGKQNVPTSAPGSSRASNPTMAPASTAPQRY